MEIVVRPDMQAVAREAAERVVAAAAEAISSRGRFTFALAGGSTPAALYELLSSPEYENRLDWSRTEVFFGDERCVPPDHEWSNYSMARRLLIDRVPISRANVHRIAGELRPDEGAAAYASTLRAILAPDEETPPRFDLILLGMGDDGHTASLFPGMPALLVRTAWVIGTTVPEYVRPAVSRVTLTLPVLNAARAVLFLVTGLAKAESVQTVLVGGHDHAGAEVLPAAQVRPHEGLLTWLLDQPAASLLKE